MTRRRSGRQGEGELEEGIGISVVHRSRTRFPRSTNAHQTPSTIGGQQEAVCQAHLPFFVETTIFSRGTLLLSRSSHHSSASASLRSTHFASMMAAFVALIVLRSTFPAQHVSNPLAFASKSAVCRIHNETALIFHSRCLSYSVRSVKRGGWG